MNKIIVKINNLPRKIKIKIIDYLSKNILLVGYKKISEQYRIPIIELSNKQRIWVLKHEIKDCSKI